MAPLDCYYCPPPPSSLPLLTRVKLLAMRLQYQLEETMDDLDDIGFDEQVLSGVLRTAHLEISGFIGRCDRTMLTTEQRILRILLR